MNQDPWQWNIQNGEPVIVSPRGALRQVRRFVEVRGRDGVWRNDTSDAAMFVEAMNLFEKTRAANRAAEEPAEPSGRAFHVWEHDELNFNMADVVAWGWRWDKSRVEPRKKTGVWLEMKGGEEEYIVGIEYAYEFVKHWRQYQQWRHINWR